MTRTSILATCAFVFVCSFALMYLTGTPTADAASLLGVTGIIQ